MDNNDNNYDLGRHLKSIWKRIPLALRIKIALGLTALGLFFLIIITIISLNPINHLFFNDKASSDGYNMDAAYNEFIANPCTEDNKRCADVQKQNYAKLKKDEEKFIKKLDKISNKYGLENEQKYILLTTIFYGFDENFFYTAGEGATNFTMDSGAYVLDGDDDIEDDGNTLITGIDGYLETDTLKELGKQFKVFPVNCTYNSTDAEGNQISVTEPLTHDGVQMGVGFWEKLMGNSNDEGFKEAKETCLNKDSGKLSYDPETATGEASKNKYYQYLEENTYLDSKDNFQKYFFKPYFQAHNLKEWTDEDLKAVRKNIIETIKEIVADKLALDQRYNLNNACSALAGNSVDYWWPLADSESGGFAAGESTKCASYGNRTFGMKFHPIEHRYKMHNGNDIPCPSGTPVIAAKSGTILFAAYNGAAGNMIKIQHADGVVSIYMHLSKFASKAGDEVQQGQVIGYVGSTGSSTGAHLHFETRIDGEAVDSRNYVDPNNQRPGGMSISSNTLNPTMAVNTLSEHKVTFLSSGPIQVVNLANTGEGTVNPENSLDTSNNTTSVKTEDIKTSEEKRKNQDPISSEEIASYDGTNDIWTSISQNILDAAGVDKNGNKIDSKGVTFHEKDKCQMYVGLVYKEAGLGDIQRGSAREAASQTLVSKSMSIIPVGAAVYGASSSSDGHVGIYIGNGKVIHNIGSIKIEDLKSWAEKYKYIGWGWQAGEDKLSDATSNSGVSSTGLGTSTCSPLNGSVEGNGPEQTVCLTLKNAGFSVNAIAAIMGNIDAESSWNPTSENEIGATGLIQWMGDRLNLLKSRYPSNWQEPKSQAEYILYELNNKENKSMKYIQTHQNDDINSLTEGFCNSYERPGPSFCAARKEKGSKYVSYVQNNCGGAQGTSANGHKIENRNGVTYIDGILIVNKTYSLPSNYAPSNIKSAKVNVIGTSNKQIKYADNEAYAAYLKLFDAGRAAGVEARELNITSGYRSYSTQSDTYNYYKSRNDGRDADTYSARPGYSEHQTGLAFDLGQAGDNYNNKKGAKFIQNNAYKYGFILRYPKGKQEETGYKYESWHIRYVGVDLATKLYNNGDWITLEAYFDISSRYSN